MKNVKTKIIDGVTVVSSRSAKIAYAFKRTGTNIVAVSSAICADGDKFKHKVGRELALAKLDAGASINLRLPSDSFDMEDVADIVQTAIVAGNSGTWTDQFRND